MPKKSFQEELGEYIDLFNNAFFSLKEDYKDYGKKTSLFDSLIANLSKLFNFAHSLDNNVAPANDKDYEEFPDILKSCKDTLSQIVSKPLEDIPDGAEKNINENCEKLHNLLNGEVSQKIESTARIRNDFVKSYVNGDEESLISEQFAKVGLSGHAMSINDCKSFSINNPDMDKTIDQLMWLANQDYMRFRLYGTENTNVYSDALERFSEELDNAPADVQQKFAIKLMRQQLAVKDACLNKFNEALNNCPAGEDPQLYAHMQLNESPEYQSLSALTTFKSVYLFGHKIVQYESSIGLANVANKDINSITNRPSNKMGDLANGDMGKFLGKHGIIAGTQKLEAHEIERYEDALKKNGFINSEALNNIIKENDNMLKDSGKSSKSMQDMRDTVNAFLDLNHGDPDNTPGYHEKLEAAINAVNAYKESHQGYRFTSSGKERMRIATALSESLANFKREQEARKVPVFNPENFTDGIGLLENSLSKDAGDAISAGLNSKQYADRIAELDKAPKTDYQTAYNDARKQYLKRDPNANIPELNFAISDEEKQQKQAIHNTALRNLAKAKFNTVGINNFIDTGIKYGEMTTEDKKFFDDRDLPVFLFDIGDDGKTKLNNINRANKFLGKDINRYSPKYEELLQKRQAEIVQDRINELKQKDYDKYLSLNDKELAGNFEQISRETFPLTVMEKTIQKLKDNNPYITDKMLEDTNTLVNKYSCHYPYLSARMNIIASNYYSSINDKELANVSSSTGRAIGGFQSSDDDVTRLNNSVYNLARNNNNIYTTLLKNSFVTKASDNKVYEDIPFYDENGEKIDFDDILDKSSEGTIYTLEDGDPTTLKAFKYGGEGFTFKEESIDKNPAVCEKIRAVESKEIKQLYTDYANAKLGRHVTIANISNDLIDLTKGISQLNYRNKLTQMGLIGSDIEEPSNELKQIHNAIYKGKSLDEVKNLPAAKNYQDVIGELYKAGRDDYHNKALAASTVDKIFNSIVLSKVDTDLLKQEAKAAGIELMADADTSKAKYLQNLSLSMIKDAAKESALNYSVLDRGLSIAFKKDGLSDDDKAKISADSYTHEGSRNVIQTITDDVLSEDFSDIDKTDVQKYMDNYKHLNYIRFATFDTSYMSKPSFDEIFTPQERSDYEKMCAAFADPLNFCDCRFNMNACKGSELINPSNVSIEQAFQGTTSPNKNNKEFWAFMVTNVHNSADKEKIKAGQESYERLTQGRWTNTLLSKPGISKDEVEFINSCLKSKDPQVGRIRLYEYAQSEFIKAAEGINDIKGDPEKAAYIKACSSAGKMLMNQMKRDGYDIMPEQKESLVNACNKMSKVEGNISIALNKGRALNEWAIKKEKDYELANAEILKQREQEKIIGLKNSIERSKNVFADRLKEAILEGDLKKITDAGSSFMYYNKLEMKSGSMTLQGLLDATNDDKIASLTEQVKPAMKDYAKTLTIPSLKDLANTKNFAEEFTRGFNYFTKDIKLNDPNAQLEGPDINKDMM